ncbi:hypothetical protein BT96DRAFT_768775, partial [Gymnopus androsaceus JB14]
PVIHMAAARGLVVVDKYYAKTDDSLMYCLEMIMHLKHKLTYFNKEGWLPKWKEEAKRLLHEHWDTLYK